VEELSRRFGDLYFRLRGPQPTSQDVVLVLIDDASLAHYGRWPWPRHLLADLLRAVSAQRPRVVGLDILLSEPENERNDAELSDAIRTAGNVVLAAKISGSPENRLWVEPLPRFARATAGVGHVQAALDPDGVCRRVPVSELTVEGPRLAFALEAARIARGLPPGGTASEAPGFERKSPDLLLIDYRGQVSSEQSSSPFLVVSARDLLADKAEARLQGKAVLIGFGATELSDRLATPVSDRLPMPGVEINANLLDQLLAGRNLRQIPELVQLLALLGLCMLATWIALHWPGKRGLLGVSALLLSVYGGEFFVFTRFHRLIDFGPLLCAGILAAPLAQLENLMFVDRALTARLRELRDILRENSENSGGALRVAMTAGIEQSVEGLQWKVELLKRLQSELISLYAFDNTLLEAMREGLAVFAYDGRLLYHNPSWQKFCQRQHWPSCATLDEFTAVLDDPNWRNLGPQIPRRAGELLEGEVSLNSGLWHLRAVRLPAASQGDAAALLVTVADMTARLERDQARAEALGFVTHELRTPLVAIQGFAELLVRDPRIAYESNAADTVFRECRRLVAMINTYLDVLRLDAGHRPLRQETMQTEEMVRQVRRIIEPLAEAAAITIEQNLETGLPSVQGDTNLIAGALLNLLSNAVKYSPRGSEVKLHVSAEGAGVVFEVRNPGPVIPGHEISRLFEPFYRGAPRSDSLPGWGLGLAFVKRIAERHGGRIEATSSTESGTCFRLLLPSAAAPLCEVMI
jgi:signal transduction histidine kinase/CHASE2 domain-containing sensor protein